MTTLEFLRTHRTVVERIRRASEREFTGLAALETAVAVELLTTDERMDISSQYSAASASLNPPPMREVAVLRESNVAECGPGVFTAAPRRRWPGISFIVYPYLSWSFHE
jgi:hypothetical protein